MKKMRKEIAVGLLAISFLLVILGAMLYKRMAPHSHAAGHEPPIARSLLPIPEVARESKRAKATLVTANEGDSETNPDTHGWAAREHRQALAIEPEATDYSNPASSLPNEAGDADPAANTATILTSGSEAAGGEPTPADAPPGGDPFARRPSADDALAGEPTVATEPSQADAGYTADLVGEPLLEDRPTDAVATSGTFPDDMEPPRAGLRNRFPQAGESLPADTGNQPGRFEREGAEFSHHAHPHATVENGKYTVQPNDSYWTISEKVYGDGGYFKAIYEHNRLRHPRADKLAVGDTLETPHSGVLVERYPELCPKQRKVPPARNTLVPASTRQRVGQRVYQVAEGDTLFDIAKYELGKSTRWNEIYELNRDVLGEDFDYLRPGTELVLPHDHREAESVTRGRDPGMQR